MRVGLPTGGCRPKVEAGRFSERCAGEMRTQEDERKREVIPSGSPCSGPCARPKPPPR